MLTTDESVFQHDFWGEKNQGFSTLYHNMKHGHNAAKEVAEFFRESAAIEDSSSKALLRQGKAAASPPLGTFSPLWLLLKTSREQLGSLHAKLSSKLTELSKDMNDYSNSQKETHKTVKDDVNPASEAVQSLEAAHAQVLKSKKTYTQVCHELEEAKEAFIKAQKENHKVKEQERLEARMKRMDQSVTNVEFDYKAAVTKHKSTCDEFEQKMHLACLRFEKVEDEHLQKMHMFVMRYLDLQEEIFKEMQTALRNVRAQALDQTISKLFEEFVRTKGTGKDQPVRAKFEQNLSTSTPLPSIRETSSPTAVSVPADALQVKDLPRTASGSGLRKTLGLKRLKRKKKQKDTSSSSAGDAPPVEVDAEGYSIRPVDAGRPGETGNDSDFSYESDDEPGFDQNKLRTIKIRPMEGMDQFKVPDIMTGTGRAPLTRSGTSTSSVDKLKQTRSGSTLVPLNDSESKSLSKGDKSGSHNSLLDLDIDETANLPLALTDLQDNYRQRAHTAGPILGGQSPKKQKFVVGSGALLAPPPGSRAFSVSSHHSPETVRTSTPTLKEDDTAVHSNTKTTPISHTPPMPSPITSPSHSGAEVTCPIAIAFSEVVNAMFKDPDPKQCLVKVTGDMMISFPTSVVQRLASHTSSTLPTLTLQIVHAIELEHVLPNTRLLNIESQENNAIVLKFSMGSLVAYLKRQVAQSPSSSYHNADILKYQVKSSGTNIVPLTLCSHWKCEPTVTNLKVDYTYNDNVLAGGQPLTGVTVIAPVNGGVQSMTSKPEAAWIAEQSRVSWRLNEIRPPAGSGSVQAKFNLSSGPGSPSPVALQFMCDGTTLSGINIQVISAGYRLSLLKKTFKSGKYTAEQR
ncbi:F-BAR domain only protein 1-like [Corticium candelabrum]|uniref:F-BAR domain only protein 1-like n=1 Tax=Corticium candelabrum TaxID=121492 RepID=UPI002E257F92|nr:F-BAR domain only protein 1-like [Corticium candelabrum]